MEKLDRENFEHIFNRNYLALCRYALGIIGDGDQSEDIVQHAYIKLWEKRDSMDMSRSLKSYLYTSVRNGCINYIRDQKKFQSNVLDIEIYGNERISETHLVSEELMGEELGEKIRKILKSLPEKSREVFEMSRMEKMKYREIAEELGVTVKTVEAHMSRALKILREELSDYLLFWVVLSLFLFDGF